MATPQSERPDERSFGATEARQGEIVLRRPWQRMVFVAGLVGLVVLALIMTGWMLAY